MPQELGPEIVFPHLGITINKLSKVAFNIFGIDIYWYAITMTTAIFCALLLARHLAKKTGQKPEMYDNATTLGIVLALGTGRLYFVIFGGLPLSDFFKFRDGGLAIYGAVIGIFLTGYITAKWYKVSPLVFLDTVMPAVVLGQVIGRWGNFINREAFGNYTDNLFAMRVLAVQAKDGVTKVAVDSAGYIQVHPTFFYESMLNLILLVVMLYVIRPRVKFDGEMICWYMLGYGVIRFFVEGLRTDQLMLFDTGLAVSQLLGAVSAVVAVVLLVYFRRRLKLVK